jgi:DNA-binding CsgD family transcriptional regulator
MFKDKEIKLTKKQREIMLLATTGMSNLEMAQHLNMSQTAISQNLSRIYKLLGVPSRGKAVALCRDLGLL